MHVQVSQLLFVGPAAAVALAIIAAATEWTEPSFDASKLSW